MLLDACDRLSNPHDDDNRPFSNGLRLLPLNQMYLHQSMQMVLEVCSMLPRKSKPTYGDGFARNLQSSMDVLSSSFESLKASDKSEPVVKRRPRENPFASRKSINQNIRNQSKDQIVLPLIFFFYFSFTPFVFLLFFL